jgi:hypothetical protein
MAVLAFASLAITLVVVLVVAYHLIGIYLALRKGRSHLAQLAGGLTQIRDDTAPLNAKIETINKGLSALAPPLLAANGNLVKVVEIARG